MTVNLPTADVETFEEGLNGLCDNDRFAEIMKEKATRDNLCYGSERKEHECRKPDGNYCLELPDEYPRGYNPFVILQHNCTLAGASVYQLIRLDYIAHTKEDEDISKTDNIAIKLESVVDNKHVFDSLRILVNKFFTGNSIGKVNLIKIKNYEILLLIKLIK